MKTIPADSPFTPCVRLFGSLCMASCMGQGVMSEWEGGDLGAGVLCAVISKFNF